MSMTNEKIMNAIQGHLTKNELAYRVSPKGVVYFQISMEGRFSNAYYIVDVRRRDFIIYAKSPINGNPDNKAEMLELSRFFAKANYTLKLGNYEMDYRDGEIRYKVFMDCDGLEEPTDEMIRLSIGIAGAMLRRYSEGILGIIYKNLSAEEALALCK